MLLKQIHILIVAIAFYFNPLSLAAQALLQADGPGNTYELINSILAPGYDVVENPECVHPEFGRHIAEVWDSELNRYVFEFYIHVTPDNDRCINFDRQRIEIKTYDASPDNLIGVSGETVVYKWKFRIPIGFKPSPNFTHIHQIKAVGGNADDPIFTLTPRYGSPNKIELIHNNSTKVTTANLSLFEGNWVEATEIIKIDSIHGTYSIVIKKISDGSTLLTYSNSNLMTIRYNNTFIRPKWGIYRSLLKPEYLRDETLRFNDFSIGEVKIQTISFPTISSRQYGDSDFDPGATINSGLTIVYASSNTAVATIVAGKIHIVGAGTSNITASQSGDMYHFAAVNVTQQLTVSKANQSITFNPIPTKNLNNIDFSPGAMASSGLPIDYISSNPAVATIIGGNIHIISAGTSNIIASQIGNLNYNSANEVTQILTVSPLTSVQNQENDEFKIKVYPNPVLNSLCIDYFLNEKSSVNIEIFDLQGKMILNLMAKQLQADGYSHHLFDLSNLGNGLYFVIIRIGVLTKSIKILVKR